MRCVQAALQQYTNTAAHTLQLGNRQIYIIDTPGFSDTQRQDSEILKEIASAVTLARDGAHAICICVRAGRPFGEAEQQALKQMEMLGDFWNHTFIVFTEAARYGKTETEQLGKLQHDLDRAQVVSWLLRNAGQRYMLVESLDRMEDDHYHKNKLAEFTSTIDKAYEAAGCCLYTNELFKFAQRQYEELMDAAACTLKMKSQLETDLQKMRKERDDLAEKLKETRERVESEIKINPEWLKILGSIIPTVAKVGYEIVKSQCSLM